MSLVEVHVGLDDADSPLGFCTTFLGLLLVNELKKIGAVFLDLPYLVRLDPNIPAKTRGNGAVSLHFRLEQDKITHAENIIRNTVERFAEKHGKTDPAVVISTGNVPEELKEIFQRALSEYVPVSHVHSMFRKLSAEEKIRLVYAYRDRPRGLIGAVSAVAAYPLAQYTYELLVYRDPRDKTAERNIDTNMFLDIDKTYRPYIFSTFDYNSGRLLATPHGPDPVLFGLRSLDPDTLLKALGTISGSVSFRGYMVFKTNQATNMHLKVKKKIASLRPYDSVVVYGRVDSKPRIIPGGHVFAEVCDDTGCITVAFYKETGSLNRVSRLLRKGDKIEVGGGVIPREKNTLNAEILRVVEPAPLMLEENPRCPKCGARMTSAGRNKGYKCPKCRFRSTTLGKNIKKFPRILEPGLYIQSPIAFRHLTKPREIYGLQPVTITSDWLISEKWFYLEQK
jgi:tRNA(Ile2)-agmatinylcytidine synthase